MHNLYCAKKKSITLAASDLYMPFLSSVVKNVQKKRFGAYIPVVALIPALTAYKTEAVQARTGGRSGMFGNHV